MTIPDMPTQQPRAAAGTDARGWLVWDGPLPDDLQAQEDATQSADFTRRLTHPRGHQRDATSVEVELLTHLGYQVPPDLQTTISWPSANCRRRRWLALET